MSDSNDFSRRGRVPPSSPAAKARLARALRENLQRRKAQARGQEGVPEKAVADGDPGDKGSEDKNGDRR